MDAEAADHEEEGHAEIAEAERQREPGPAPPVEIRRVLVAGHGEMADDDGQGGHAAQLIDPVPSAR
jgi:hypothetical protein